jgi:hypothetical protein
MVASAPRIDVSILIGSRGALPQEWNGWLAKQQSRTTPVQTLRIPSLRQACNSMLTWNELLDALRDHEND